MQFGYVKFHFRWVPTLLLALPIPLFVALGVWQIDRAEQKREQARILGQRAELPALELGDPITDPDALRFRKLRARGTFEVAGQILITNRRQGNRVGFHVITPLHIRGSDSRVLVNRGWIATAEDGGPVATPVPERELVVTGEAYLPAAPAFVLHGNPEAAKDWGSRWPYLTLELYTAATGIQVQPVIILQDPDTAGGFLRLWPRESPKEGMHIGYAIQWFAFALIALVLWLRFSLVRRSNEEIAV